MANLKNYELTIIIDTSVADVATVESELEASLSKRSAEITHKDDWGVRKLFHPPKHIKDAHFKYFKLSALPEAISQINTDLRVNQGVLKSLLISI